MGVIDDQARLNVLRFGQSKQLLAAQHGLDTGHGLADQQGLFLPIAAHEGLGAQGTQQGVGQGLFQSVSPNCDNSAP
jgi:hypothetical protein